MSLPFWCVFISALLIFIAKAPVAKKQPAPAFGVSSMVPTTAPAPPFGGVSSTPAATSAMFGGSQSATPFGRSPQPIS